MHGFILDVVHSKHGPFEAAKENQLNIWLYDCTYHLEKKPV